MDKKDKANELVDELKPVVETTLKTAVPMVPGLLISLENYNDLSTTRKREAQLVVAQLVADSLLTIVPGANLLVPTAVLLTRIILEYPDALKGADSPQVKEAVAEFPSRIGAAEGRFEDEKEAVDSTFQEVLSLPQSMKAAALVIMLGACGSASWDAVKYTYSEGQRILEQQYVENKPAPIAPVPEKEQEMGVYVVIGDGLRLRSEPSTNSRIDALIYQGDRLVLFEVNGDWAFVNVLDRPDGNNIGWVHRDFIARSD